MANPINPPPQPEPVQLAPSSDSSAAVTKHRNETNQTSLASPRQELEILIRARYPLIYVRSWDEERVERALREIVAARGKQLFVWTATRGIERAGSDSGRSRSGVSKTADPMSALDAVIEQIEPAVFLFKDLHPFMSAERCNISIIRRLRDVAHEIRDTYKTVVISAPTFQLAPELAKGVTLIEFGLPDTDDLSELLDRILDDVAGNPHVRIDLDPSGRERLLRAARGLTLKEAENVFAKMLVVDGRLDSDDLRIVFSEKRQIIRKGGLLEYCETTEEFEKVAGLENLKRWLSKRSIALTDRAASFGLTAPRGVLLLGVPGCGKSLCAKSIARQWQLPLLRWDPGRMFSSLVGSSEDNVRRAIEIAESVAPVVLWIDEIDRMLADSSDSPSSDGGTSSRVFGTFLTWLSEKTSPVFVVATANDVFHLPPELLRKGRFDEIFFVDLPSMIEREVILRIHLQLRARDPSKFDIPTLALASEGFSGAEIEQAVVSALFDAFSSQRQLRGDDIATALRETVPLSKMMPEELGRLRSWAAGRARFASEALRRPFPEARRKIEL